MIQDVYEGSKSLGFSDGTVDKILAKFPRVIMLNENEIQRKNPFLLEVKIPKNGINGIFRFEVIDTM
ncbi:hypothetical protein VitviT2T_005345 [Vitis vinifera]|uniref:Uncharacterized protein n=1 Tax=Vitis vinifera TaxID=29760 RepID=A0ABY9BS98_VITVI|nr:hypothetical protein VitviT2T_005345 [Vitis vinifera]